MEISFESQFRFRLALPNNINQKQKMVPGNSLINTGRFTIYLCPCVALLPAQKQKPTLFCQHHSLKKWTSTLSSIHAMLRIINVTTVRHSDSFLYQNAYLANDNVPNLCACKACISGWLPWFGYWCYGQQSLLAFSVWPSWQILLTEPNWTFVEIEDTITSLRGAWLNLFIYSILYSYQELSNEKKNKK